MPTTDPTEEAALPLRGFTAEATADQRRWESRFRSLVEPASLREHLRMLSHEPHHAGSAGCKRMAEYILGQFRSWGLDARIEELEALLPQPVDRVLELLEPERFTASLEEPPIAEDSTSASKGQLPTFNAYSADGDVTAPLVYINYGVPKDYEVLARLGITVEGAIVIARYGGTAFRGLKPKTAAEHGAVGCIIYSDPKDDGWYNEPAYPDGPSRPARGVQRGSTYYMPIQNGDPLTPGWASEKGGRKLAREEAARMMPPIPVLPISHADARPLLEALGGAGAPEEWQGALPITYRIGPGPAKVHLKVSSDWATRPIYNVIARIEGSVYPDQWIIRGNHHDAWVHGATDPGSGNMTLLETARALGQLVREGWRPKRTIVIASWDAEEWGLIGSTEWAEKHAAELEQKAVAYINTDLTGRQWLTPGGSHSLQRLVSDAAKDVVQPGSGASVFEAARAHLADVAVSAAKQSAGTIADLPLYGLGAETDYAAFIGHLGIASLDLWFDGDWSWRGVYHSTYDSFHWYTTFGDPSFEYGKALTETSGTILMRLAEAAVLPFGFEGLASAVSGYVDELETLARSERLDWSPLRRALGRLEQAGANWEAALSRAQKLPPETIEARRAELASVNRLLYSTERLLRYEPGLPDRPWFRHLLYASDPHHGRVVSTLPMIREGIERGEWTQARAFVEIVADALSRLTDQVGSATEAVHRLEDIALSDAGSLRG